MQLSDDGIARLRTIVAAPDFGGTRYEIGHEIGRGGMGVVYAATDLELNRAVAIKVLAVEQSSAEAADRLRREARLVAQLDHPGIVPIHDAGALPDGRAFYVMKLVRGRTLSDVLRQPHGVPELLRLFVRICEPVAFAHARGVVHCDLKPSNIMVGEFGEVLVLDWGIANEAGGTRGYMAPEQEQGTISSSADVFALGVILRQMISAPTRRLRAIVAKATAADASSRYAGARELADDVTRYLDDQPLIAYRETPLERAGRWISRNRALLAVIAAYLLMRVIVLVIARR